MHIQGEDINNDDRISKDLARDHQAHTVHQSYFYFSHPPNIFFLFEYSQVISHYRTRATSNHGYYCFFLNPHTCWVFFDDWRYSCIHYLLIYVVFISVQARFLFKGKILPNSTCFTVVNYGPEHKMTWRGEKRGIALEFGKCQNIYCRTVWRFMSLARICDVGQIIANSQS